MPETTSLTAPVDPVIIPSAARNRRSRSSQVTGALFGAVGLVGVVVALRSGLDEVGNLPGPGGWELTVAAALVVPAHMLGAQAFAACLGPIDPEPLARAYYVSQLGKYVPGGIWQPVGQVVLVRTTPTSRAGMVVGCAIAQICFVVAGTTIAAAGALALTNDPTWRTTAVALTALSTIAFLDRRVLTSLLRRVPPRIASGVLPDLLPTQDQIYRCAVLSGGKVMFQSASFALLLGSLAPHIAPQEAAIAYAAGWMAGVLAVPVPSGIGVREAVLALVLGTSGAALAPVLAASVLHRVATMVVELALAGAATARAAARSRRKAAR